MSFITNIKDMVGQYLDTNDFSWLLQSLISCIVSAIITLFFYWVAFGKWHTIQRDDLETQLLKVKLRLNSRY